MCDHAQNVFPAFEVKQICVFVSGFLELITHCLQMGYTILARTHVIFVFLSVEKCVFVLLGSLHYRMSPKSPNANTIVSMMNSKKSELITCQAPYTTMVRWYDSDLEEVVTVLGTTVSTQRRSSCC